MTHLYIFFLKTLAVQSMRKEITQRYTFLGKVKCTLVRAMWLYASRTSHRGSKVIALPIHDHGSRGGCGVSFTPWPLFTSGKDPVPITQEVGWAQG
jgi:hypothetical protein